MSHPLAPLRPEPRLGVLVVDDEEMVRDALLTGLKDIGFNVWCAASGFEAVKLFRRLRDHIAVILIDVNMPTMDGIQTMAGLREVDTGVPVCLLAEALAPGDEQDWLTQGAGRVFLKSVSLNQLASTLRRLAHT